MEGKLNSVKITDVRAFCIKFRQEKKIGQKFQLQLDTNYYGM